ncbi:Calcineurin subunit B [Balamuthia mandrillaris]
MASLTTSTNERIVKSLFQKYDKDQSGSIDNAELKELLQDMGVQEIEQAASLLADKNQDGHIDWKEFYPWWCQWVKDRVLTEGSKYKKLQQAFAYFQQVDKDGSGSIDKEEYIKLCDSLGYSDKAGSGLAQLDKDQSGTIDFQEFLDWLKWL